MRWLTNWSMRLQSPERFPSSRTDNWDTVQFHPSGHVSAKHEGHLASCIATDKLLNTLGTGSNITFRLWGQNAVLERHRDFPRMLRGHEKENGNTHAIELPTDSHWCVNELTSEPTRSNCEITMNPYWYGQHRYHNEATWIRVRCEQRNHNAVSTMLGFVDIRVPWVAANNTIILKTNVPLDKIISVSCEQYVVFAEQTNGMYIKQQIFK